MLTDTTKLPLLIAILETRLKRQFSCHIFLTNVPGKYVSSKMFPATLDASRKKLRTVVSKGHRSKNVTSSDKSEKHTPGIKDATVQPFGDIFSTVSSVFYLHKKRPLCDQL
jgi:hypothetical protein